MILTATGRRLELASREPPHPGPGQVLLRVAACGVCRTDLHVTDGDLTHAKLPLVPGHEIVGRVAEIGAEVEAFHAGQRVGVPWLGWSCGVCDFCRAARENLCDRARFTGYTLDGGYAEYAVADARYCFALPDHYSDAEAAPLMCAGLIGHRALRAANRPKKLGIYGFGAAAHIVAQVARAEGADIFAFVRPGDDAASAFAREIGACWAGPSNVPAPEPLDAAIIFAPVGALVPAALRAVQKGGRVVAAGIHMSDIPAFPYAILWGERELVSIANLTRRDGEEFLRLAPKVPVKIAVQAYPLEQANAALDDLRAGRVRGAAVLTMP